MRYLIGELINKLNNKGWKALEEDIANANAFRKKPYRSGSTQKTIRTTIERRKLKLLADGHTTVPLTQHDLELFDTYLRFMNLDGLAETPIFKRSHNLFHELTAAEKITFFIGARYVDGLGEMIARWDISALNTLRDKIPEKVSSETIDVATRNLSSPVSMQLWQQLQQQATGNVIISIGSPIASASSEYLLSQIFSTTPYRSQKQCPPLCFIKENPDYDSAFVSRKSASKKLSDVEMIVVGENITAKDEHTEFAVIVGQRTGPSNTLFVVCGSSGPGTLAAAECLAHDKVNYQLPDHQKGRKRQPVLLVLISTNISSVGTDPRIDKRRVAESHVESAQLFEYGTRKWTKQMLSNPL